MDISEQTRLEMQAGRERLAAHARMERLEELEKILAANHIGGSLTWSTLPKDGCVVVHIRRAGAPDMELADDARHFPTDELLTQVMLLT